MQQERLHGERLPISHKDSRNEGCRKEARTDKKRSGKLPKRTLSCPSSQAVISKFFSPRGKWDR